MNKKFNSFYKIMFILSFLICSCEQKTKDKSLDIIYLHQNNISEVLGFNDSLIPPIVYDTLISSKSQSVLERKSLFVHQVLPSIVIVRYKLYRDIHRIQSFQNLINNNKTLQSEDQLFLDSLNIRFRTSEIDELVKRMSPHPASIVLAQAVVESGWGKSRICQTGNNIFGVWTTADDLDKIQAEFLRNGETPIYLKKYANIEDAVLHYYINIGRHRAYSKFRNSRANGESIQDMIDCLGSYSEIGSEYTQLLKDIIRWNNFERFDSAQIDLNFALNP